MSTDDEVLISDDDDFSMSEGVIGGGQPRGAPRAVVHRPPPKMNRARSTPAHSNLASRSLSAKHQEQIKKINNQNQAKLAKKRQEFDSNPRMPPEAKKAAIQKLESNNAQKITNLKKRQEAELSKQGQKSGNKKSALETAKKVGKKAGSSALGGVAGFGMIAASLAGNAMLAAGKVLDAGTKLTGDLLNLAGEGIGAAAQVATAGIGAVSQLGTAAIDALGGLASGLGSDSYGLPSDLTGFSPEEDAAYDETNPDDQDDSCENTHDREINKCTSVRDNRILNVCIKKYGPDIQRLGVEGLKSYKPKSEDDVGPYVGLKKCITTYDIFMVQCISKADDKYSNCQSLIDGAE